MGRAGAGSRARRARWTSLALLASVASLGVACGGSPPPAPESPAKVAEAPPPKAPPPPDTSAVPEPKSLLLFARVTKPQHVLDVITAWTGAPGLGADAVAQLVTGEEAGSVVDLTQPIDLAVAADFAGAGPRVSFAMSIAAKPNARAALSERFDLVDRHGVTRLRPKHGAGDDDGDDDDRRCALFPSAGPSSSRLVCGGSDGALTGLGPYLTRTTPRAKYPSDVHLEARLDGVRPAIQQGRALLPTLAASALGSHRPSTPASTELVNAVVGDVVDLALDLDKITFDGQMSEQEASASLTTSFRDAKSLLAKMATSHPERAGAPPPAFFRLPVDADAAFFRPAIDAPLLERPRDVVNKAVSELLDKGGVSPADRKAVTDAFSHVVDVFGAPSVYARGLDGADVQKKIAAVKQAKEGAAREDAERAATDALHGWSLMGIEAPIAKVGATAKELVAAVNKPSVSKWSAAESKDAAAVTLRTVPVPAKLGLPKDSVDVEITSRRAVDAAPVAAPPAPRKGGKPAPPPKPAAPKLGKPTKTHLLLVPDAGRTWLVIGADEALLASKVKASMTGAPEAGTLAKRDGLDDVRSSKASSGGFVTVRGVVVGHATRWLQDSRGFHDPFGAVSPTGPSTPIPVTLTVNAGDGSPGSVTTATKVPRAAIQEILAASLGR